jgi:hypothetical protein
MSTATKKFALAALSTPVLAALAIGLAGSAVAAPAGPQPSDTGTTTTRGQEKGGYNKMIGDVKDLRDVTNLSSINLSRVDPIGDGVWGQTDSSRLGTAARPTGRTARGATQRRPLLGGTNSPYDDGDWEIGKDTYARLLQLLSR